MKVKRGALLFTVILVFACTVRAQAPPEKAANPPDDSEVRPPVTKEDVKIVQRAREILLLAPSVSAAEKTDFSGSFTLSKVRGGNFGLGPKKGTVWTLDVIQTSTGVQVTKVRTYQRIVNTFPLNGTEGVCKDPYGTGKCKGHFKGKYLYLDSFVVVPPTGGRKIQGHMIERWELSADLSTLAIRNEFETTDANNGQIIPNNVRSWSEVYTRNLIRLAPDSDKGN
jgi:hypothetical protein